MNKHNMILLMPLSLLSSLIISCSTPIPNVPACVGLNEVQGFCTYTNEDKDFMVDNDKQLYPGTNQTWQDVKLHAVIVPADSWAAIKEYILTMCKKNNSCAHQIDTVTNKVNSLTSLK